MIDEQELYPRMTTSCSCYCSVRYYGRLVTTRDFNLHVTWSDGWEMPKDMVT